MSRIRTKPTVHQTYAQRVAAGRRAVAIWVDADTSKRLDELGELWGIISVRDVVAQAIRLAHDSERK